MKSTISAFLLPFALWTPLASSQQTATACGTQPPALTLSAPSIFSEQQEQWLGDAEADMLERQYRPVKDKAESAYLQGIGDRLLAVLPPTTIKFRFVVIDSPEINGFSLAGGRVYITRKLIANAHSEDEVAGVLAHEIGHILTHQFAIETTADLKRLMAVTSLGDRADVYAKFQRLVDLRARDTSSTNHDSDEKQDQADRVAVYAAAAAGYRPQAYPELWDRSFFVGGKTGNRFLDFFGATKPSQKRLRLMRQMITALPPGCGSTSKADTQAFATWHELVMNNQRGAETEMTVSSSQVKLEPALRMGLDTLRFSPDGKYLLAQDQSSVFVYTREPFHLLFGFDAGNASPASFTPDSTAITFITPDLHVERWNIAEKRVTSALELNLAHDCMDPILSPDGRTLVCVRLAQNSLTGFYMKLGLYDVETGTEVYHLDSWFNPSYVTVARLVVDQELGINTRFIPRAISPDGNLLVIGPNDYKLAFDLRTRTPIKMGGAFNKIDRVYAFVDNNALAGVNFSKTAESGIFSFPDGKLINKMDLKLDSMGGLSSGHRVKIHGKDDGSAIADLDSGKVIVSTKTSALDIWQSSFIAESDDGSLRLFTLDEKGLQEAGRQTLPLSPLGRPQAVRLSQDGQYLAFSTRYRGAIWDLQTGKRLVHLHGFRGAYWKDTTLYATFAEEGAKTSQVAEMHFPDLATNTLPYKLEKDSGFAFGRPYEWKTEGKKSTLTMHGRQDNSVLWTHDFVGDIPNWTTNPADEDLIFALPLNGSGVNAILHTSTSLQAQANAVHYKDSGWLIQILSGANGAVKDQVVIETPIAFDNMNGFDRVENQLYLSLGDNRVVVYDMATGKQMRQVFGNIIAADNATGRICVLNRKDELTVYSNTGQELTHIFVGGQVRFAALRNNAAQVVVLTTDQQIKRFAIPDTSVASAKP